MQTSLDSIPASVKIFSGSGSEIIAKKIAEKYQKPLGNYKKTLFSDGEIHINFRESVRGCDVFLIQSTQAPTDNIMELLFMIDAARRASAQIVTVVIPYFGYARQDRKDQPRVSIAAKLIANLLSAAGTDRIITCDLHAGQIQGFFDIPVDHLDSSYFFIPYLEKLNRDEIVFAAPDVGGTARTRHFAKYFKADMVVCDKHRERANEVSAMQVIGNVVNKNIILVDDLIDTGGTLCKAADIIMEKGAKSIRAICTHPILSGKAYENIENSKLDELIVSDTIPLKRKCDKIKVLSSAELFAKSIKNVHENASVSSLFYK